MVIATRSQSTYVITGELKSCIPSRIAFRVGCYTDSLKILDISGAENLLGKGDMLYLPLGQGKPIRVQGAYISDENLVAMTWEGSAKSLGEVCE